MSRLGRGATVRLVAVVVALTVVGAGVVGLASGQSSESYSLSQDGQCTTITPLSGTDPVKAFYGYNLPYPDNPYGTGLNESYSSEGTTDLQENETSLLFLYRAPDGNLSLVVIHGTWGEGTDGGAASFEIDGLPAEGTWAVKDDLYNNSHNYDRWSHTPTSAEVDWTWSGNATDGGAYAGLGDDFRITIDPAFNEEATLYGQHYNGTVEGWQVLSGDRAAPERVSLDRSEPATVSSEPCDGPAAVPPVETDDDRDAGEGEANRDTETTEDRTETTEERTETEDDDTETTEGEEDETETTEERTERPADERETDDGDRTDGSNRDDGDDEGTEGSDDRDADRSPDDDRNRDRDGDDGRDRDDDRDREEGGNREGAEGSDPGGFADGGPFGGGGPFGDDGPLGGEWPLEGDGPFDGGGPFGDDGPSDTNGPFDGNVTEG